MALYTYIAAAAGHAPEEVTIEADNPAEALAKLRGRKLLPVRLLGEADTAAAGHGGGGGLFRHSKINVLDFTGQLAPLLHSAIPLERALGIIAESTVEPEQKAFVLALRQGLHEGKKFSALVRGYGAVFPGFYANLIETGEETGCLPEVVEELRGFMEESNELREFIVSSSIYPLVVLTITLLVTVLMFTVFVPKFAQIFIDMGRELPGSMLFLMSLSHLLLAAIFIIPAALLSAWYLARWRFGAAAVREFVARAAIAVPIFGRLRVATEMGKFTRTLAILVSNHVDIIRTVRIAVRVIQNQVVRSSFSDLENRLKGGEKLSAALAGNPYVPAGLAAKLRVGEESGTVGMMLSRSAGYLEADTRRRIKRLLSLFEPVVIVFLAGVVMIVVIAIFMAIMQINSIEN